MIIKKSLCEITHIPRLKYAKSLGLFMALALINAPLSGQAYTVVKDPAHTGKDAVAFQSLASSVQQQQQIRGSVRDAQGIPIAGVTIKERLSGNTTHSDSEGHFNLSVPQIKNAILEFSSVGYQLQEQALSSAKVDYTVVLLAGQQDLEEVVVVGYGSQKKVNLTGAISVVKGEDLVRQPVGQTSAALQGAAPGLTVTQTSGQPGRDTGGLRIRGVGTLGNANPLVLVDGVEGNINHVNPNDIASISVLKDASSAAIYGSRAANGVILITTKRGVDKGLSLDYSNYFGLSTPTELPEMTNGLDHMLLLNEAYTNTGRTPIFTTQFIDAYRAGKDTHPDQYPDTDWAQLTMKKNAFMQNHYLSINGGNERVRVVGSLGYLDQKGILANTNFKKYNFRLNNDLQLSQKISAAVDVSMVKSELLEPSAGTTSIFHWMRRIPATQAGLLSNGQYGEGWNGNNPLAMAQDGGMNRENPLDIMLNMDVKYKPFEGLVTQFVYSPKFLLTHQKSFINPIQSYNYDGSMAYLTPQLSALNDRFDQSWYNNIRAIVSYEKKVQDAHQVNVMVGYQQEDQDDRYLFAYREAFQLPEFQEINAGSRDNQQNGGTISQWALRSAFGRINYNFKGKYLLEANGRYDGSSRFAKGNKFSFFPSFSGGWRISQESFMEPLSAVVTDLKLRGSWGRLGNQNIGLYPFSAFVTLSANNYAFGNTIKTGAAINSMANSEIKWETTTVTDIGVDLQLWKNLHITADYYYRKTDGILLQLDVPLMLGQTAPYQNAGVVENKGWDLSVSYRNEVNAFKYHVTANLSDVKNKVLDMRGVARTGLTVNLEGSPIGSLYGYEALGLFQSQQELDAHAKQFGTVALGDIKYKDQNGDGIIDKSDEIVMGSAIPRYSFSLNLGAEYRGFDLSIFLQGVGKADGYIYGQGIMPFYQGSTAQQQHKDRWTPENPKAAFPRMAFNETNNIQNSTFWMKDASYLRLKNISFGYTLPQAVLAGASIQQLRIFATGQNLFTSTSFWKGFDPEGPISTGGWYPQMKVYSLGLSVKF